MPICAEYEGKLVTVQPGLSMPATLLEPSDIAIAKTEQITFTCRLCRGPMHIHQHRQGFAWYFQHNPGAAQRCRELGGSPGESSTHRAGKVRLAQAIARLKDWTADLEVPGEGCQADVVAYHQHGKQVPFEVQLSKVGIGEVTRRTLRDTASFLHQPLWFHVGFRDWSTSVPAVRFAQDDPYADYVGPLWTDRAAESRVQLRYDAVVRHWLGGQLEFIDVLGGLVPAVGWEVRDGRLVKDRSPKRTVGVPQGPDWIEDHELNSGASLFCPSESEEELQSFFESHELLTFDCPRCGQPSFADFYGPCSSCRASLQAWRPRVRPLPPRDD